MIKILRKKFITITALTLLGVLLTLIIAINALIIYRNDKDLTTQLNTIISNQGRLPDEYNRNDAFNKPNDVFLSNNPFQPNKEKLFTTRFCVVNLNTNKDIIDIYSDKIAALTNNEIKNYTQSIINSGKISGWIDSYKYKITQTNTGYMLVILDASLQKQTNLSVFLISTIVVIVSYIIILLIIILCSKKAIMPVAQNYEKQKQFITDASHELKTPLTIISANSEIIEMTYGEDEWIDGIKAQVECMKDLVNSLVTLAKLDEENKTISFEEFCISDVVSDTAKSFEGLCKSTKKHLNLNIDPDIKFKGNKNYIRQLASILLDNAFKYCDDNGNIDVRLVKEKYIFFSISNSYSNVKNIELNKLLDRFYKVDKARTQKGSYGLGLSIASSIVNSHNGKIEVKNIDDKMIQFEIKF